MQTYLTHRLLLFVPTLLVVAGAVFALIRLVPGDVAELVVLEAGTGTATRDAEIQRIRRELALDQPAGVQFLRWLGNAARGNLGRSFTDGRPVLQILTERIPRSVELAVLTMTFALLWAVPFGVVSATRRGTWVDHALRALSAGALSLPVFLTGVLVPLRSGPVLPLAATPRLRRFLRRSNPQRDASRVARARPGPLRGRAHRSSASIAHARHASGGVRPGRVGEGLGTCAVVGRHALWRCAPPILAIVGVAGGRLLGRHRRGGDGVR